MISRMGGCPLQSAPPKSTKRSSRTGLSITIAGESALKGIWMANVRSYRTIFEMLVLAGAGAASVALKEIARR